MDIIIFLLAAYGISNIMVYSSIFQWWRTFWDRVSPKFFGDLFQCMMCLPFWVGVILSIISVSLSSRYLNIDSIFLSTFIDGCLTSGSIWLIHTIQEKLEK